MTRYIFIICFLLHAVTVNGQFLDFSKKSGYIPNKRSYFRFISRSESAVKINSQNCTLDFLNPQTSLPFTANDTSEYAKAMSACLNLRFQYIRADVADNIQYITPPVVAAYQTGRLDLGDGRIGENFTDRGTLVRPVPGLGTNTVFYNISALRNTNSWSVKGFVVYFFIREGTKKPILDFYAFMTDGGDQEIYLDPAHGASGGTATVTLVHFLHFVRYLKQLKKVVTLAPPNTLVRQGRNDYLNSTEFLVQVVKPSKRVRR